MDFMDRFVEAGADAKLKPVATPKKPSRKVRPIVWATWACLALGLSGLVRTLQDSRLADASQLSDAAPFPLKELPLEVQGWTYRRDVDESLDPRIAAVVGSKDHLVRTYEDEATGVILTLLIIYGNGLKLSAHIPEICYPNVGYAAKETAANWDLSVGAGTARFRSLVFNKSGGLEDDRQEVYYSFLHKGDWDPDAIAKWNVIRQDPAMFKIQVARSMAPQERRVIDNPTAQFLKKFVPKFEEQLTGKKSTEPNQTQIVEPSKAGAASPEAVPK